MAVCLCAQPASIPPPHFPNSGLSSLLHPLPILPALPTPPPPPPLFYPLPPAANWGIIRTFTPPANVSKTFYFRKSVTLSRSACIQGLIFDFIPKDGFSLFINNVEALRYRMPAGTLYVDSPVSRPRCAARVGPEGTTRLATLRHVHSSCVTPSPPCLPSFRTSMMHLLTLLSSPSALPYA